MYLWLWWNDLQTERQAWRKRFKMWAEREMCGQWHIECRTMSWKTSHVVLSHTQFFNVFEIGEIFKGTREKYISQFAYCIKRLAVSQICSCCVLCWPDLGPNYHLPDGGEHCYWCLNIGSALTLVFSIYLQSDVWFTTHWQILGTSARSVIKRSCPNRNNRSATADYIQ